MGFWLLVPGVGMGGGAAVSATVRVIYRPESATAPDAYRPLGVPLPAVYRPENTGLPSG